MTHSSLLSYHDSVSAALAPCGPHLEQTSAHTWTLLTDSESDIRAELAPMSDWLTLSSGCGEDTPTAEKDDANRVWNLLEAGAALPPHAQFEFGHGALSGLRADLPLKAIAADELGQRVAEACTGMEAARLGDSEVKEADAPAAENAEADEARAARLNQCCCDSGWAFDERSPTKYAFELESTSGFYRAIVETRAGGITRVHAKLTRVQSADDSVGRAVASYLMTSATSFKMVRAYAEARNEAYAAGYEILFHGIPSALELNEALCALSVACDRTGACLDVLNDTRVADRYLEMNTYRS